MSRTVESTFTAQTVIHAMVGAGVKRIVKTHHTDEVIIFEALDQGTPLAPAKTERTEIAVTGEWATGAVCTVPVYAGGIGRADVTKPLASGDLDENAHDVFDPREWEHAIRYAAGLVER